MAWPLYELTALVRAIDVRDVSTVARYVNFDRVRASLTEQIASAYIRRSGVPALFDGWLYEPSRAELGAERSILPRWSRRQWRG